MKSKDRGSETGWPEEIADRYESYSSCPGNVYSEGAKRVVDAVGLQPSDRVLDICCGTGAAFPYIGKKLGEEGQLIGVDKSEDMLEYAEDRAERTRLENVGLIQGDANYLSDELGETDVGAVICNHAIWHLDMDKVFEEVAETLDDYGKFGFSLYSHVYEFEEEDIIDGVLDRIPEVAGGPKANPCDNDPCLDLEAIDKKLEEAGLELSDYREEDLSPTKEDQRQFFDLVLTRSVESRGMLDHLDRGEALEICREATERGLDQYEGDDVDYNAAIFVAERV